MKTPQIRSPLAPSRTAAAVVGLLSVLPLLPGQAVAPAAETDPDVLRLQALVVTATARPGMSKLKSSVSLSSIDTETLDTAVPRSTAEVFRSLPGIRSEATSGDGNANLTVRGAPLSAGGSRYLQLQEDGLPLLQFGDIAFGTADSFLRPDFTVDTIEAVRGGSASTFASNSPGGVINLISKTGANAGGSAAFTQGLDFESSRLDFNYGSPVSSSVRLNVGGFYRTGEGPREAGYNANNGGQFKANLTKEFGNGYVRLFFKHLDDRTITYLPIPVRVTGSNGSPNFASVPGFDRKFATLNTPYLQTDLSLDGAGNRRVSDIDDGIHAVSTSLGAEINLDLGDGWTLIDRVRVAKNDGQFIAPFPAEVASASSLATSIGGPGATLRYANGPLANQAITAPDQLNGNGLLTRVHLFNTSLNNFDLFAHDLRLNKSLDLESGFKIDATAGYYKSRQSVDMDWTWNTYLQELKGDSALIDVYNAAGRKVTEQGLVAYGVPFWGNLHRSYDVDYDTDAPFASVAAEWGSWNFDASVRFDRNRAQGNYAGNTQVANYDMNQDGTISVPEQSVSAVNNAAPSPVNYRVNFTSYSLGANYAFNPQLAGFVRYSQGASASADRILFGSSVRPDGSVAGDEASYNELRQFEGGVKYQTTQLIPGSLGLFATFFHAETTESNYELTSRRFTNRVYLANGLELEGVYVYHQFTLRAGVTFTDAEIDQAETASLVGKTPRRQADWVYQFSPSYRWRQWTVGGSVIGTTKAYAQDNNDLVFPAYAYVNTFVAYALTRDLTLSVQANNLFNTYGITEAEEGSIPSNGIIRARGITGRTVSATLRYTF